MSDKVYIEATVRLVIRKDSDIDIGEVMGELDYNFTDTTGKADVEETDLKDWEVNDVK